MALDGQGLNDAIFDQGLPQLELPVLAEWVKRVELVWGPGPSVCGSNALLGVDNIVTPDGADAPGLSMSGGLLNHELMAGAELRSAPHIVQPNYDVHPCQRTSGSTVAMGCDLIQGFGFFRPVPP